MSYDIKYPNMTAHTEAGKLEQIRSYLYQLTDQLNWALNTIEKGITENIVVQQGSKVASGDAETPSNFNELKSLIIKSADVVEAFEEEFSKVFDGKYVAQSGFGEYMQNTSLTIEGNSTNITQIYSNTQSITDTDNAVTIRKDDAYIKTGRLYTDSNGNDIYGLEIGQTVNGRDEGFVRLISNELAFCDGTDTKGNPIKVAYISGQKLFITRVEITGTFILGKFVSTVDVLGDVVEKWVE